MELTHLSLFSGIGGLDLAAEWAGFETVGQCEWAEYPTKVLEKHWPDVARWKDIKTLTKESFYEKTGRDTVTVISGGFPCQPFSVAGKRKGKEDDRYIWPELHRTTDEIRPLWFIGENVSNILNMGIEICISDLAAIGYRGGVFCVPAEDVGAMFKGERVFIIATTDSERWICLDESIKEKPKGEHQKRFNEWQTRQDNLPLDLEGFFADTSSRIERNDDGLSEGVDRLKAIGNAVMPYQAYPIFESIANVEMKIGKDA